MNNSTGRPVRMDLKSKLNRDMFKKALADCERAAELNALSDYESRFYYEQQQAWDLVGDDYRPTVKQFNYLRQIAVEVVKAGY